MPWLRRYVDLKTGARTSVVAGASEIAVAHSAPQAIGSVVVAGQGWEKVTEHDVLTQQFGVPTGNATSTRNSAPPKSWSNKIKGE